MISSHIDSWPPAYFPMPRWNRGDKFSRATRKDMKFPVFAASFTRSTKQRDGDPLRTNAKHRARCEKVCDARDGREKPSHVSVGTVAAAAATFGRRNSQRFSVAMEVCPWPYVGKYVSVRLITRSSGSRSGCKMLK